MRAIKLTPSVLTIGLTSCLVLCVSLCAVARDASFDPSKASKNSFNPPEEAPITNSATGVVLHKDQDIQGIWIAPGFNFHGYDALCVNDTIFKGKVRDNETEARTAAIGNVQAQFVIQLKTTDLFPKVLYSSPEGTNGKTLQLTNTIVEYSKGGGGARYFAGLYGAGQPHIHVHGEMYDGNKLVFIFEAKRSGESAGARLAGGFMGSTDIQTHDIYDMAHDLAACVKRNSTNDWK